MSGDKAVREMSHSEKILEESGRQTQQVREIYNRLVNIRECLLGSIPADPMKEIPPPVVAGIFGSLYVNLYESGRVIETTYDELRVVENGLGIVSEPSPAPATLRTIGPRPGR